MSEEMVENVQRYKENLRLPLVQPLADAWVSEKEAVLLVDLPGVKAADVQVDADAHVLTIVGDVIREPESGTRKVYRESGSKRYKRTFRLAEHLDQEGITAKLKDGVLEVRVPVKEASLPRKIEVQVE